MLTASANCGPNIWEDSQDIHASPHRREDPVYATDWVVQMAGKELYHIQ